MNVFENIVRKGLCLSINEWNVLLEIYTLSKNIKHGGWCIKSKKNISDWLDISERIVFKIINTLEEKGLVERNDSGHTRTTDEINQIFSSRDLNFLISGDFKMLKIDYEKIAEGMQKIHRGYAKSADQPMQKMQTTYAESADKYNSSNTISNTVKNKKGKTPKEISTEFFENPEKRKEFFSTFLGNDLEKIREHSPELDKFIMYWTEPNQQGTKQRWQMEKTFDVPRRLVTWMSRSSKFKKPSKNSFVVPNNF